MATSDDGKLNKALDAIAALPSAPAPAPASAEPVVNAAAMAALVGLTQYENDGDGFMEPVAAGDWVRATDITDLLARFTVREPGGEVRDD